jgi:hypothetical protein
VFEPPLELHRGERIELAGADRNIVLEGAVHRVRDESQIIY